MPRFTLRIAKYRDVVTERIYPDIDDLLGVIWHLHAPAQALFWAANRHVVHAVLDQLKYLIAAKFWHNSHRTRRYRVTDLVGKIAAA